MNLIDNRVAAFDNEFLYTLRISVHKLYNFGVGECKFTDGWSARNLSAHPATSATAAQWKDI